MKKLSLKGLLVAVCLLLAASFMGGCTIAKISGAGPRPLLLNNIDSAKKFSVVKHFVVEETINFDWTNSVEIDRLIAKVLEETKADAVVNLRITGKFTVGNYCMNAVTCGIANSKTWAVEGDAIKYE